MNAARLDGEVFAVDECFQLVDSWEDSTTRGRCLAATLPPRLIAEQRTAAWVHGALLLPPRRHELCAATGARFRALGAPRWVIREVVVNASDLWLLGGMMVTTPLRTVIDLARFSAEFDSAECELVQRLASVGGFDYTEIQRAVGLRRNLPGKRRALERLHAALALGDS